MEDLYPIAMVFRTGGALLLSASIWNINNEEMKGGDFYCSCHVMFHLKKSLFTDLGGTNYHKVITSKYHGNH